ncbi:hypothetical protein AGMMS49975_30070 [Clostridia bacterium]|nr:hypothetical protein AGMMS49975_30070 [Clostridia bacterium]
MLETLKKLRTSKGYTQAQISDLLKCTQGHYQKIEQGQIDIPLSKAMIISDFFGVPIDYLIGRLNEVDITNITLESDEKEILDGYKKLGERNKGRVLERILTLSE